jgi:hypothetical protein
MTATADANGAACTCTAASVPYDHASSGLAADNVQDAVDELASRPIAEAPVDPRIKTITVPFTLTSQPAGEISKTAACSNEATDVVLGGACGYVGTQNFLLATTITNSQTEAKFVCSYTVPATLNATSSVTVVCLTDAK